MKIDIDGIAVKIFPKQDGGFEWACRSGRDEDRFNDLDDAARAAFLGKLFAAALPADAHAPDGHGSFCRFCGVPRRLTRP